ncbi:MAG: S1C family serine protease [Actinomycetota bacterium]
MTSQNSDERWMPPQGTNGIPAGWGSPSRDAPPQSGPAPLLGWEPEPPPVPRPVPAPAPSRGKQHRGPRMIRRSTAVLVAVLALLSGLILGAVGAREYFGIDVAAPVTPTGSTVPVRAPDSVAGIAQSVVPSTVYIEATTATSAASGTGLILRADGYIVTNNHVIAGGGTVQVTFSDGSVEVAEVVGRTSDYDLAVLKVERTGLDPLPLADSDAVMVGDPVVAVGAPLGLEGTVTSGIVSALNRAVTAGSVTETSFINAIQTDAAINPGNSGGPLVNAGGEVIGINTAIAQASGTGAATGSIGLGFAIPSNQVRRTTDQLIETGRATYPIIGILLDGRHGGEGVMVATAPSDGNEPVTPGGPGDSAGIRPGDIILSIDGRPVTSPEEVIVYVRANAPGDTLTLTIRRGGREEDVDVVLGEQEAN